MKRFNFNELLWFIILVSSAVLLTYLLKTSDISNFIHPKMNKYLIFATAVLIVIAFIQFFKIFTIPDRGGIRKDYLIFLVAIIMVAFAANKDMGTEGINLKGVKLSTRSYWGQTGDKHQHHDKIPAGTIELLGENYYCYLEDIEKSLNQYIGRDVVTEGFIYKNSTMSKNEFIVARSVMSCCAADSQIIGIKAVLESNQEANGQWVELRGKIYATKVYEGNKLVDVPLIKVDSLKVKEKPTNQYIYQN